MATNYIDIRIAEIKSLLNSKVEICTRDDVFWLIKELGIARQNHFDADTRFFQMGRCASYLADRLAQYASDPEKKDAYEWMAEAMTAVTGEEHEPEDFK